MAKTKITYEVNGEDYTIKEPIPKYVDGEVLKKEDQYFRRRELPEFMHRVKKNKAGDLEWDEEQKKFIRLEFDRCKERGYWFMNNGKPTYITNIHYFYLQYYTLENGKHPEYRDVDRRWFYFLECCLKKGYVKGIVRLKKRREGATSQTCCMILWQAIFFKNSRCGIVSKTDIDAETAYLDMVLNAWNELFIFFKPDHDRYIQRKIRIRENKKKDKKGIEGDEIDILASGDDNGSSEISHRATALNSYDSGRLTLLLVDEAAKWSKVNILKYVPIVLKTMMEGIKRVGFCIIPTTMNNYNDGGENFVQLWRLSNQFQSSGGRTQSGLYKYFVPAYDGYPGFIGKYGESIIDTPTPSQLKYLTSEYDDSMDITRDELKLGARLYLENKLASLTDETLKIEARRADPFTEEDALLDGRTGNYFVPEYLNRQLQRIQDAQKVIRVGRLDEDEKGNVHFIDDPKGGWHFLELPQNPNAYRLINGLKFPVNTSVIKIGCDPFRNTHHVSNRVSNGTIVVMKNEDSVNPREGGYPFGFYRGRPRLKGLFYEELDKCCRYMSAKANVERDIDDFYEFFLNIKRIQYLRNTPSSVIDPQLDPKTADKKRLLKGTASADRFALNKELEFTILWFERHWMDIWFPEIIEDLRPYDHENRTKSDLTVALMMAVVDMASVRTRKELAEEIPFSIPSYETGQFVF